MKGLITYLASRPMHANLLEHSASFFMCANLGVAVLATHVLHRGDGSFTNPFGFGRARRAWFAPVDASGRCTQVAVEAGPSSVFAYMLLLALGWHSLILLVPFRLSR
jgi:hypothetical protein